METIYLQVVKCNEFISLRSADNTAAPRLLKLPLGTVVEKLGVAKNGFLKVKFDGKVGYALASYLTEEINCDGEPGMPDLYLQVVKCKEFISLRSKDNTAAPLVAKLPLGTVVQKLGEGDNGFYRVRYMDKEGYALASYLSEEIDTCKEGAPLK